mmetsp:Transcript_120983/g.222549  ORF Transcript_120983/g.222549 Transcript_120983/m.222549 type:complete len:215 (-) Transcript_120983:35-679(-)
MMSFVYFITVWSLTGACCFKSTCTKWTRTSLGRCWSQMRILPPKLCSTSMSLSNSLTCSSEKLLGSTLGQPLALTSPRSSQALSCHHHWRSQLCFFFPTFLGAILAIAVFGACSSSRTSTPSLPRRTPGLVCTEKSASSLDSLQALLCRRAGPDRDRASDSRDRDRASDCRRAEPDRTADCDASCRGGRRCGGGGGGGKTMEPPMCAVVQQRCG